MLSVFFLSIFVLVKCCYCFNIDTNYPIVYEDPSKYLSPNTNTPSYFGYSLVLYPGNPSTVPWILIGAPKGTAGNKNSSGTCFKCKIANTCELFDINAYSSSASTNYVEILDHAWLGGSMDINYGSKRIVTCAPRWIKVQKSKDPKKDDYHMQGVCYWFHTEDNSTQKLLPLYEPGKDIYTHPGPGGGSVYYYAQGQAGFSLHMPVKETEIILGAPGVYNWDGTTILYKDNTDSPPVASRLQNRGRSRRYADASEFSYKNIANAIETKQTLAYDLLGYASTSGYFYSERKLSYVSSAPRSDYKGQILIYEFAKTLDKPLIVLETKHGEQFGEYFGGAVTAGDINNDGLDDLIVGAPFHTAQKYNEGKIYIFLGSKTGRLQERKQNHIVGKSTNGQFGTTVQYLGRINGDLFGDVAVAAPYEDEKSGVVYIFRGTAGGLDTNFCQRIVGKSVYENIRGFGMSISRAVDMDHNRFPDIAIGAYLSGHVILLRSRPVITIFQNFTSFANHLEFKSKSFEMSECFSFQVDQIDIGTVTINRTLTLDQELGRASLRNNDYERIIELQPNEITCQNFTVTLTGSFSNRYDPITVSLSHTYITQEKPKQVIYVDQNFQGNDDPFCVRCPVYNPYGSISSSTLKIPFALGCKSGNICKANLEMTLKINGIGEDNTFVLGAKEYLTLQIDIRNSGEKAYLTQVLTTVPDFITFRSTPSACTEKNSSSVTCSVDNPLDTNSQKSVTLELDMTTINSGKYDNSLTLTVELFTSSENNGDTMKKLEIKLKREADVFITGKSEEQSYSYRNISEGAPHFTQVYQVEKFGRSLLDEIRVEINIPYMYKAENGQEINLTSLYPPIGTLAEQDVTCTSDFTYKFEDKQSSSHIDSEGIYDNAANKESSKRFVRQVQVFNKSTMAKQRLTKENELETLQNRTYYVNCSMTNIVCSKVICTAGPIKSGQVVKIKLNMVLNVTAIKDLLGKKDVILFGTQGRVVVTSPENFVQSGDKPDTVNAVSLFIGESQSEDIALWIIIASIIAGFLLLLLLVVVLIKAGFFKRATKEELEQLKKEMEYSAGTNLTEKEEQEDE